MVRAVVVLAVVLGGVGMARAEDPTTGTIGGHGLDKGDVIKAKGPHGTFTGRVRETGSFWITGLVPGLYDIWVEARGLPREGLLVARDVDVGSFGVTYLGELRFRSAGDGTPSVDVTSRSLVTTLDRTDLDRFIPNGPYQDGVFGIAPTSHGDGYGLALADSSSFDNRYLVNGIDTTDIRSGGNGIWLPNELLSGVSLLTGGGDAATTRNFGGVFATTTRSGSNQFHGSVFAIYAPGALVADAVRDPGDRPTIDVRTRPGSRLGIGAELGGPIVRDHVWFWLGFAPRFETVELVRTIASRTDCRKTLPDGGISGCDESFADGEPDRDPKTGELLLRPIETTVRDQTRRSYPIVGTLDVAHGGHRANLTAIVAPSEGEAPATDAALSTGRRWWRHNIDLGARWSHDLGRALRFDASLAWHHQGYEIRGLDAAAERTPQTYPWSPTLAELASQGFESRAVGEACVDGGATDEFRGIENCPIYGYATGGPGRLRRERDDRLRADVGMTARVRAAGMHALTTGLSLVEERSRTSHALSGGRFVQWVFDYEESLYLVRVAHPLDAGAEFDTRCTTGELELRCHVLGGSLDEPGATVDARSQIAAAYVSDTWQPVRGLLVEGGLRYERQRLFYPHDLAGALDPETALPLGDAAFDLGGTLLPRAGLVWSPTDTGTARLFAHAGRYVERLPTALVNEKLSRLSTGDDFVTPLWVGTPFAVAPSVRAPYVDELLVGGEGLVGNLLVGASWKHRALGRVVDDVNINGRFTYTNPEGVERTYDGLTLTLEHRRSRRAGLLGSYTYSLTRGNYTGVFHDDGSATPEHTASQFDLPELAINRTGALPLDRPHYVKVDAWYQVPLSKQSELFLAGRFRALSGTPRLVYSERSLLLPRGSLGRLPETYALDVRIAYRRQLSRSTSAELYLDVFNVLDRQDVSGVDADYGWSARGILPIDGGTYEDLVWLRSDRARNPRFGRPQARYSPATAQIGARVRF